MVRSAWLSTGAAYPLSRVAKGLKAVRKALKVWSRVSFGDIFMEVKKADKVVTVEELEPIVEDSPQNRSELNLATARLKQRIAKGRGLLVSKSQNQMGH